MASGQSAVPGPPAGTSERPQRLRPVSLQRQVGAYYTCPDAALAMAGWVLEDGARRVLEPSFGAGVFVNAIRAVATERGGPAPEIYGAELVDETFAAALSAGLIDRSRAHLGDFLGWNAPEVDAVIGNPPYVRLRHLPADQGARALQVSVDELGTGMETSGSVWMPFVLHAAGRLRIGGRMALVLPFDFTYVRYARPLWRRLGETFGSLRLVRVHERLFPAILQDVVILYAGDKGGTTPIVRFDAYDRVDDFLDGAASHSADIALTDLTAGDRAFMRALLPAALTDDLGGRLRGLTQPVRESAAFNIGYVCGHKGYFHPDAATRARFDLPDTAFVRALTSTRQVKAIGLRTAAAAEADRLFLPRGALHLGAGEAAYVAHGEALGVHERYKCRVREPWYVTPGVRTPDLILSVFSERPVLTINDGGYAATNSLLCGFLKAGTAEELASAWYSSLTLLGCESEVHALGGGVMVLVPKETGNIRIPKLRAPPAGHLAALAALLANGEVQAAYDLGDDAVLRGQLRLPVAMIDRIRRGVHTLAHWRTSARGGLAPADEGEAE